MGDHIDCYSPTLLATYISVFMCIYIDAYIEMQVLLNFVCVCVILGEYLGLNLGSCTY